VKALSLTQPWAQAVVLGSKRIETRSWSTRYRGPIAIHAAKRYGVYELIHQSCCWNWCGALWGTGYRMGRRDDSLEERLAFGAIVGVVTLVDCRPSDSFTIGELDVPRFPTDEPDRYSWTERQLGDFSPGRFGFVLENPVALPEPVPCRGALGLWNVPGDVQAEMSAGASRTARELIGATR
jgi:hypothetical protein